MLVSPPRCLENTCLSNGKRLAGKGCVSIVTAFGRWESFRTLAASVDYGGHGHSQRFRSASPDLPLVPQAEDFIPPENAPGRPYTSPVSDHRWSHDGECLVIRRIGVVPLRVDYGRPEKLSVA